VESSPDGNESGQARKAGRRRIVIGGGPAGFFAAIRAAELEPSAEILLLEKSETPLAKVLRSGGGRCNLTHDGLDPAGLAARFPRGARELLGPFSRFSSADTLDWFHRRGVATRTEADGRVFPETQDARTVAEALLAAARSAGVGLRLGQEVKALLPPGGGRQTWTVRTGTRDWAAGRVVVATGADPNVWRDLAKLGHRIVSPVPSLFAFRIVAPLLEGLSGLSVPNAEAGLPAFRLVRRGPLLLTHWGLSGPLILTLSAWAARELADCGYRFDLVVNWTGESEECLRDRIEAVRAAHGRSGVAAHPAGSLPARLWSRLVEAAGIPGDRTWARVDREQARRLIRELRETRLRVEGKSRHLEEFVTAGGVDLRDVHSGTFESRIHPGLFVVGEALNVDAVTGGFNFQAAWTTGYLAGTALASGPDQVAGGAASS
jgi:predicted Rossmann fold flavoprotein